MLEKTLKENLRYITPLMMALIMAMLLLNVTTGSAHATALPVNPTLPCASNGSGCLNGSTSVQVLANSCINFYSTNNFDACTSSLAASDTFLEIGPSDLATFPPLLTTGTIKDLQFGTLPPLSFLTIGNVTFDLTGVVPSALPACPTNISTACSDGVFSLTQTSSTQVSVGFNFDANACTNGSTTTGCTAAGGSTPYIISYTAQLNNQTIQGAINQAGSTNGITNSVSFTANPLPEPNGLVLIGAGLIGISVLVRRRGRARA